MANTFIDVSIAIFLPVAVGAGAFLMVVYIILWLFESWDDVVALMDRGHD